MEPLKDAFAAVTSDENPKIKEEVLSSDEYNFPEKVATSRKSASEEEREFKVTFGKDGRKHTVRGRLTDSLFSALRSNQRVCAWMNRTKRKEFHLIDKTKSWDSFINLGMPLKYVPDGSQFEMKSYKLTDEVWYRQYDDRRECILFYVRGIGSRMESHGKQSRTVIKNGSLINEYCTFCIFAPKEESIKDALCNDGRFMSFLKEENWTLVKKGTITENNYLVKILSDQPDEVYEIHVESKKGARYSGDLNKKQNDLDLARGQLCILEKPQGQPDFEEGQLSASKTQQPQPDYEQGQLGTSKLQQQQEFECQLLHLYPKLKEEGEKIFNFLNKKDLEVCKKNFGKEVNDSLSAILVETLATRMNSVGYIEWRNDLGCVHGFATCFVLHGRYILTCYHVVEKIVGEGSEAKDWGNRIKQLARVTFSYKKEHPPREKWFSLENWFEISDKDLDFAVLKLEENESKSHPPPGLLQFHSPPPPNGPVFITGHPKGGIKSMDVCVVVSVFERGNKYSNHLQQHQNSECSRYMCGYNSDEKCIHSYNPKGFDREKNSPDLVTYNTCFFEGSSGSPVFDKNGKLVAMHAAGFAYKMGNKECSIIEWGYLICSIILKIKSKFGSWFDSTFSPDTSEDNSHVDAFQNEAEEKMDCS
ncbi:hypothetical protein Chor_016210 [Crotalus horridus]